MLLLNQVNYFIKMEHNECFVNVTALSEVFLENNKSKLKDVDNIIIDLVGLDDSIVEKEIKKETLSEELNNIFRDGVSHLKEINLNFKEKGLKTYLTGISIFK